MRILLILFCLMGELLATEVLEVSRSKRSFILSLGKLEGLAEGDEALLYSDQLVDKSTNEEIGYAEAIKVFPNYSFWFMRESGADEYLQKGKRLSVVIKKDLLKGRLTYRVERKKIYSNDQKESVAKEQKEIPTEFLVKENLYQKGYSLKTQDGDIWKDPELIELERLYKQNSIYLQNDESYSGEVVDYHLTDKSVVVDMTKHRTKEATQEFLGIARANMQKNDEGKNNFKSRKRLVTRDPDQNEFPNGSSILSSYNSYQERKQTEQLVLPSAVKRINDEPGNWSKDMNDRELREFVVNTGIARETQKQRFALENKVDHEFLVRYGVGTVITTTEEDPYHQHRNNLFEIGYELHLYRISEALESFSAEFFWATAKNHLNSGLGYNMESNESLVGVIGNYYLIGTPSKIASPLIHLGMGLRFGEAELSSMNSSVSRDYLYDVRSMPIMQIGAKYRFRGGDEHTESVRVGIGLNMLVSVESTQYGLKEEPLSNDDISAKIIMNDTKFSMGLSIYF